MEIKQAQSFEAYYQSHYDRAFRFVLKRVQDRQTAEDITMDAFVACYERFGDFDPARATFATWLYVVLKNKLKNFYRDRKVFDNIDDHDDPMEGFEDELLAAEYLQSLRGELAQSLEQLPEVQRQIVAYKYIQNKNATEIAFLMGLEPGNVRVQLSRALKKMRSYLEARRIGWEL